MSELELFPIVADIVMGVLLAVLTVAIVLLIVGLWIQYRYARERGFFEKRDGRSNGPL